MDEYRSKSYNDATMEIQTYYNNGNQNNNTINNNQNNKNNSNNFQDLRCYSASYATSNSNTATNNLPKDLKKGKSGNASSSSSSSSSKAVWCFGDPELQRKKRVASYKSYTFEGKLKRSFSKSFRWIKDMVHG